LQTVDGILTLLLFSPFWLLPANLFVAFVLAEEGGPKWVIACLVLPPLALGGSALLGGVPGIDHAFVGSALWYLPWLACLAIELAAAVGLAARRRFGQAVVVAVINLIVWLGAPFAATAFASV
jgi:hypothetical protein